MPSKEFLERVAGDDGIGLLIEKPDGTYYRVEKKPDGQGIYWRPITEEEYKEYFEK